MARAGRASTEGARLSLCARSADQLQAVARDLEAKHDVACLAYPGDLNRTEDIQIIAAANAKLSEYHRGRRQALATE